MLEEESGTQTGVTLATSENRYEDCGLERKTKSFGRVRFPFKGIDCRGFLWLGGLLYITQILQIKVNFFVLNEVSGKCSF